MTQSTADAVVHEFEYPHPIDLVWEAIADNGAISEWLMQAEGFKPEPGTKFTLAYEDGQGGTGGVVDCEVVKVDKPKHLSYTWGTAEMSTTVTFDLESTDGGTRLRLEQGGFQTGGERAEQFRSGADWGWGQRFLKETLPKTLDRLAAAKN